MGEYEKQNAVVRIALFVAECIFFLSLSVGDSGTKHGDVEIVLRERLGGPAGLKCGKFKPLRFARYEEYGLDRLRA